MTDSRTYTVNTATEIELAEIGIEVARAALELAFQRRDDAHYLDSVATDTEDMDDDDAIDDMCFHGIDHTVAKAVVAHRASCRGSVPVLRQGLTSFDLGEV